MKSCVHNLFVLQVSMKQCKLDNYDQKQTPQLPQMSISRRKL